MFLQIFSVYDGPAEAFLPPFFVPSSGQALRALADAAADKTHQFGKHPMDYTLFRLGTFDDSKAVFEILEVPERIVTLNELLK